MTIELEDFDAKDLVERDYREYGRYVNSTRANCRIDGLKDVQRRVLLAIRDLERPGEDISAADVVSRTMSVYHPHGDTSVYDTLCRLVRKGFVEGLSNFGLQLYEDIPAAHYRYTSLKAHKEFSQGAFRFLDYVPVVENEYHLKEAAFLPVPIPLAFTTGSKGIGVGAASSIPAFSASSLFEALMSDDPSKLKAPPGMFIVSGSVEDIWTKGQGWLQYGLKCYTEWRDLDKKNVSVIEGSGKFFKPDLGIFEKHFSDETVYYRDESKSHLKLVISRVKSLKRISDEEVHQMAQQAAVSNMFFRLYVSGEDNVVRRISMRDWMHEMWGRYNAIVDEYKINRVRDLNHKIHILELLPKVAPHILDNKSTEEISTMLNVDIADVKEVESRPIKVLRKSDFGSQIETLKSQVDETKKISSTTLAKQFIDTLDKAQVA